MHTALEVRKEENNMRGPVAQWITRRSTEPKIVGPHIRMEVKLSARRRWRYACHLMELNDDYAVARPF
uniref:Uncharacterized protein n=1 Tax=Parascaris univalens TaxID=6257 RepID=A0A915BY66_PARUN